MSQLKIPLSGDWDATERENLVNTLAFVSEDITGFQLEKALLRIEVKNASASRSVEALVLSHLKKIRTVRPEKEVSILFDNRGEVPKNHEDILPLLVSRGELFEYGRGIFLCMEKSTVCMKASIEQRKNLRYRARQKRPLTR